MIVYNNADGHFKIGILIFPSFPFARSLLQMCHSIVCESVGPIQQHQSSNHDQYSFLRFEYYQNQSNNQFLYESPYKGK